MKRDNPVCLTILVFICEHKELVSSTVKEVGAGFHFKTTEFRVLLADIYLEIIGKVLGN